MHNLICAQLSLPHTCGHALIHTLFIVDAVLIMVVSGNKFKSWLELFEMCDDTMMN